MSEPKKESQATALVGMVERLTDERKAELFTDPEGKHYASVYDVQNRCRTMALQSTAARRWLSGLYYEERRAAPSAGSIADALNVIEALAMQTNIRHPVYVRKAATEAGVYLDLGSDRRVSLLACDDGSVKETAQAISSADPRFLRPGGLFEIPYRHETPDPAHIKDLRPFLNLPDGEEGNNTFRLIVAWLCSALGPEQPYPILCLHGEQGSAKSTTARVLRRLFDPNKAELRQPPKEPRDLSVAAGNSLVVAYDNLTYLPDWLSNGLCCLSTGGGFAIRKNYTDDEETLFSAMRPVLLTGISEVGTNPDLLQRSIIVTLPPIPEENRRYEEILWRQFEGKRERILAGLMAAVAHGIGNSPEVELSRIPRMADFARHAVACGEVLDWKDGDDSLFLKAYEGNREEANELALESYPISAPILELARRAEGWRGTPTELLEAIRGMVGEQTKTSKTWPGNARALSAMLRKISPNLRADGIRVETGTDGKNRFVDLRTVDPKPPETVDANADAKHPVDAKPDLSTQTAQEEWIY